MRNWHVILREMVLPYAGETDILLRVEQKRPIMRIAAIMPGSGTSVSARKLAGVLDFARRRRDWDVRIFANAHQEAWPDVLRWQPHGIIISREPTGIEGCPSFDVPIVIMDSPQSVKPPCPDARYVFTDDVGIAREAVRFLEGKGFRSFGYVHNQLPCLWDVLRGNEFMAQLAKRRMPVSDFVPVDESNANLLKFEAWAKRLPPGSAILAAHDFTGIRVLAWCRQLGIPVPGQLSVLSIGNDVSVCETTIPALASMNIDFVRAGSLAASTLAALLKGGLPPRIVCYGVDYIVERASLRPKTDAADARIDQAFAFIDARMDDPIQVSDVAAELGCSRRSVELLFRRTLDSSVGAVLRERRLERMAQRIRDSHISFSEICAKSGFSSESHAKRLFKARFGVTMTAWRQAGTV